jgi:hypothetical protein
VVDPARKVVDLLDRVDNEFLRRAAAWVLILVTLCWPPAHYACHLEGGGWFEHVMVAASFGALWITSAVLIITTDLEAKT